MAVVARSRTGIKISVLLMSHREEEGKCCRVFRCWRCGEDDLYRVLGIARTPRVTRRPSVYQMPYGDWEPYFVDTMGQYAIEVARRYYEAIKTFGTRIDLVVYVYSLVEPQTLVALFEIDQWVSLYPRHNRILTGNERDLAEELGYMTEATTWLNC